MMQDDDSDLPFSQLRAGESLLEIHIKVKKRSLSKVLILFKGKQEVGRIFKYLACLTVTSSLPQRRHLHCR